MNDSVQSGADVSKGRLRSRCCQLPTMVELTVRTSKRSVRRLRMGTVEPHRSRSRSDPSCSALGFWRSVIVPATFTVPASIV